MWGESLLFFLSFFLHQPALRPVTVAWTLKNSERKPIFLGRWIRKMGPCSAERMEEIPVIFLLRSLFLPGSKNDGGHNFKRNPISPARGVRKRGLGEPRRVGETLQRREWEERVPPIPYVTPYKSLVHPKLSPCRSGLGAMRGVGQILTGISSIFWSTASGEIITWYSGKVGSSLANGAEQRNLGGVTILRFIHSVSQYHSISDTGFHTRGLSTLPI